MLINRVALCFIVLTLVPPALIAQTSPAIIYTGATYGYLRSSDVGTNSMGAAFDTTYASLRRTYPQAILVGTGNNFAPEYGARFDSTGEPIARIPPTLRTGWAFTNKAVEFFQSPQHKYDALVPGQYDFYFGAEFLRNIGTANGENGQPILPMLGANLVITAQSQTLPPQPLCAPAQLLLPNQVSLPVQSGGGQSGGKGKGGGGGSSKSGQGASKSGQGSSSGGSSQAQACIPPPGTESSEPKVKLVNPRTEGVYPWSTEFEFTSKGQVTSVALCPVVSGTYLFSGCKPLIPNSSAGQKNYSYHVIPQDVPIDPDGIIQRGGNAILSSGRNVGLCVNPARMSTTVDEIQEPANCVPFKVQTPLFAKAWVTKPDSCNGPTECKYVIFGALDPALRDLISNENSSWIADGSSIPKTSITDPASSIQQLVKAFEKKNSGVLEHSTVVLLAQMQPPAAKAFAANMAFQGIHFDVVISAADRDQKTPDIDLTFHAEKVAVAPVFTPHPIVETISESRSVAQNPLEVIEITKSSEHITYKNSTGQDHNGLFEPACSAAGSEHTLHYLDLVSRAKGGCNDAAEFKCSSLLALRKPLDADIAMLQSRDFYDGCAYEQSPNLQSQAMKYQTATVLDAQDIAALNGTAPNAIKDGIREAIQRTFWNSEFLTRVSVSGATLKSIMQASETIAAAERSSTAPPVVFGRGLVSVGITKANGTYYVDGVMIDESKIYSIATSDQLALGDSAYPQFAQVDLIAPDVFTGRAHRTFRLADLATERILNSKAQPFKAAPLIAVQVIAALNPPLSSNQMPKSRQDNDDPFNTAKAGELEVQNRNFFTLTLQQLSVGYSFSKPNQTDTNIGQNLAGVTNPNVASPHSESLSYSDNFRLIRQFKTLINWGMDEQLTFARNRQGTLQPPNTPPTTPTGAPIPVDSISLSANTLILSPFLEFQDHRYQKRWKWIVLRPATFSTDIAKNRQFLKTASKNNVQYELVLERQRNWQPSVGSRFEIDSLNFIEAGYIHQEATNVLSGLTVNGMFSRLTAGSTAATVTNGVTPNPGDVAIPTFNTFRQDGGYWLGMLTHRLPLPHTKVDYQGITFGNFFAYGSSASTSTALTRYAVEFSNSLQISIWGNLSLAPGFNMFFFQDQSHLPGSSLVRRDLNLQLNYLFDWHQGIAWRDALRGKSN